MPKTYQQKKKFFDGMMTLYGRKTALEALADASVDVYRLHLATSNDDSEVIRRITRLAASRDIETVQHSRAELARISKNGRQDQGVAIDIRSADYLSIDALADNSLELVMLDCVTNPRNLGMIIRSIAAAPRHGLVLPRKSCAPIDPMVHKASAGTLFKAKIFHADTLQSAAPVLKALGYQLVGLTGDTPDSLGDMPANGPVCFLLGNESIGLSPEARARCDRLVKIPLSGGVNSLNVAAAAALVSFRGIFRGGSGATGGTPGDS